MAEQKTENQKRVLAPAKAWNINALELQDAFTDFILSRQAMQCTKATLRLYKLILGQFIQWLEGQSVTMPPEVSARLVRAYLAEVAARKVSDWYLNGHARAIRTLLLFWHEEKYIPERIKFDMPRVGKKRQPYLTAEQVSKVFAACTTTRDKLIISLLVDSGLRRNEALALLWKNVNLETGLIMVVQGKGKKDRITVIGSNTLRILLKYRRENHPKNNDTVIQTQNNQPMTESGLQSFFVRLEAKTGIEITPHALRRTFATLSLKNGMSLAHLQKFMGHESIETTQQYIQLLDDDLLETHRENSPMDNLR